MRTAPFLMIILANLSATGLARAEDGSGCAEALVLATYSRAQIAHDDWRLASYVTENEYDQIKHDAGASAMIYGAPAGASYSDFHNRVTQNTNTYQESLTHDEADNVMWTGLDSSASNAYSECLATKIFNKAGLHIAIRSATKEQVSIEIVWTVVGTEPRTAKPQWSWRGQGASTLPKSVPPGMLIAVLPRPAQQQVLAINFNGFADSLVIDPYPLPPTRKEFHFEETPQEYRSPEVVGWGSNWSSPFALCTDDKPAGWVIEKVYGFHLESNTERGTCGKWTNCSGENTDTQTHACRVLSVQGHNDNQYDGYGRAVEVFEVTWKHPVENQ